MLNACVWATAACSNTDYYCIYSPTKLLLLSFDFVKVFTSNYKFMYGICSSVTKAVIHPLLISSTQLGVVRTEYKSLIPVPGHGDRTLLGAASKGVGVPAGLQNTNILGFLS